MSHYIKDFILATTTEERRKLLSCGGDVKFLWITLFDCIKDCYGTPGKDATYEQGREYYERRRASIGDKEMADVMRRRLEAEKDRQSCWAVLITVVFMLLVRYY